MECAVAAPLSDYEYLAASAAVAEPTSIYCGPPSQALKPRYALPLVKYNKTVFRLHVPIEVSLYPEPDGLWICESELISILAHGDAPGSAVLALCEEFSVLWEEIANAADDSLSPDAQRLKVTLLSLVRAVEKEQ